MFGLSGGHLLILAVIVLLFGSRRLPELGSALGKGLHAFKKGLEGHSAEDENQPQQKITQNKDDNSNPPTGSSS